MRKKRIPLHFRCNGGVISGGKMITFERIYLNIVAGHLERRMKIDEIAAEQLIITYSGDLKEWRNKFLSPGKAAKKIITNETEKT